MRRLWIDALRLQFIFLFCLQRAAFSSYLLELVVKGLEATVDRLSAPTLASASTISSNSRSLSAIEDEEEEEFTVILNDPRAELMTEADFEAVQNRIKDFVFQSKRVQGSQSRKFEMIRLIRSWYTNPLILQVRQEHFTAISQLVSARKTVYIPNSILSEYLTFLIEASRGSLDSIEKLLGLAIHMIKSGEIVEILKLAIESLKATNSLSQDQIRFLFRAVYCLFSGIPSSIRELDSKLYNCLRIYLLLAKNFTLNPQVFANLRQYHRESPIFRAFLDLVPLYRLFINSHADHARNMNDLFNMNIRFKTEKIWYWRYLNFLLKESQFTNNFVCTLQLYRDRQELLLRIISNMAEGRDLMELLDYFVTNKFYYLFEGILIYSHRGDYFIDQVSLYLQSILAREKIPLFVYMVLLANCPEITEDLVDRLIIRCLNGDSNRGLARCPIYSLKRIIRAVQSIPDFNLHLAESYYWDMSPDLLQLIRSHDQPVFKTSRRGSRPHFDPRRENFYYAAQILLFKRFGIPFNRSHFSSYTSEEVDWSEAIGFVNLILERESQLAGISHFPVFKTSNK